MRVLFLSRWFPFPANNGSKLRIASLLRALSAEHELTFISFSDQSEVDTLDTQIHSLCKEVHLVRWKPYNPGSYRSLAGFLSPEPRFLVDTFSQEMAGLLRQVLQVGQVDAIIASQLDMARYAQYFNNIPAMFEEVESGIFYNNAGKPLSISNRIRRQFTRYKWQGYLGRLLSRYKIATVVSKQEQQILSKAFPDLRIVDVIPNCIELEKYASASAAPDRTSLIFTGSFQYSANYDAMLWFIREVFPRILAQSPGTTLTITGDPANKPLPPMRNVTQTGFIEDIMPLVSRAWCSVAPIRVGGGTRVKILEAMALGTPVVATSKGAEGLDVQNGRHILIADSPEEYAAAVVRLIDEPGLRDAISKNGRALLAEKYDCRVVLPRFLDLVDQLNR